MSDTCVCVCHHCKTTMISEGLSRLVSIFCLRSPIVRWIQLKRNKNCLSVTNLIRFEIFQYSCTCRFKNLSFRICPTDLFDKKQTYMYKEVMQLRFFWYHSLHFMMWHKEPRTILSDLVG